MRAVVRKWIPSVQNLDDNIRRLEHGPQCGELLVQQDGGLIVLHIFSCRDILDLAAASGAFCTRERGDTIERDLRAFVVRSVRGLCALCSLRSLPLLFTTLFRLLRLSQISAHGIVYCECELVPDGVVQRLRRGFGLCTGSCWGFQGPSSALCQERVGITLKQVGKEGRTGLPLSVFLRLFLPLLPRLGYLVLDLFALVSCTALACLCQSVNTCALDPTCVRTFPDARHGGGSGGSEVRGQATNKRASRRILGSAQDGNRSQRSSSLSARRTDMLEAE